jgi:phosphoketolase
MKMYNVVRHMKLVHDTSQEKELKCPAIDCGFTTDSEMQMKKHTTVSHVAK